MSDILEDIKTLVRTRHAIVTMDTMEDNYAERLICEAGRAMNRLVLKWTVSDGLRQVRPDNGRKIDKTLQLADALRFLRGEPGYPLCIFMDAIKLLSDPAAERLLRDVAAEYSKDERAIFMIDHGGKLPDSIQRFAMPMQLQLPDTKEIGQIVRKSLKELSLYGKIPVEITRKQLAALLDNMRGLTRMEISQVVANAVLSDGKLDAGDIALAAEAKRRNLTDTGILDYISPPDRLPKIGGMESLQKWLVRRLKGFSPEAAEYGLDQPKGILMLGVQGCGKSMMAKFVAGHWGVPLLRMDVGALYDKYVGETERHLRHAFKIADAVSPCVLWIDEIEKAFAATGAGAGGAQADGGLSQRMFGMLLTWMQERTQPIFLVATANDISMLPPELLRKGRFDEIFFVDLPKPASRRIIFEIHLARRKQQPDKFNLDALTTASEGFSGAEIEQVVVSGLYRAFAEDRGMTTDDLLTEISETRPLSVLMAEKIQELRNWAQTRCVPAD